MLKTKLLSCSESYSKLVYPKRCNPISSPISQDYNNIVNQKCWADSLPDPSFFFSLKATKDWGEIMSWWRLRKRWKKHDDFSIQNHEMLTEKCKHRCQHRFANEEFSHDVMAAILVFQIKTRRLYWCTKSNLRE